MKRFIISMMIIFLVLAAWLPPVVAQDGYCYDNPCYQYIGPWRWVNIEPGWDAWVGPEGTIGLLDLRSLPQLGTPGGPPGLGFFVTDQPLSAEYVLLSTNLDNAVLPARVNWMQTTWSISLEAMTTRGLIWEMFAEEGDPTGLTRWRPLTPGPDGKLVLFLGGYSPVAFEKDNYQGRERGEKMGSWNDTVN